MNETQRLALLALHNQRAETMMYVLLAFVFIAAILRTLWFLRFALVETLISVFQGVRQLRIARAHEANNHTRPLPVSPRAATHEAEPLRRAA